MGPLGRQRDTTPPPSKRLVLASASPRRYELLRQAGQWFETDPSGVDESPRPGEASQILVMRIARDKAHEVAARRAGRWILAADTIVVVDGEVLGKPDDAPDAVRMLERLSGREHEVMTGFVVVDPTGARYDERCVRTRVRFRPLSANEIEAYVASGEPFGKAGAYAIQGGAGAFVESFSGSWTNVVGLPLDELREVLTRAGLWRGSEER